MGVEFVDPIQQGIKTFATLKEIDRADKAEARAGEELTLRREEAGRQAAAHGLRIQADQLALDKAKREEKLYLAQQKLAPVLARAEQWKLQNGGSLKGFKDTLTPGETAVIGETYGANPTFFNTPLDELPAQVASLDVIRDGAKAFATDPQFQGKPMKITAQEAPDVLQAFNFAFAPEINKGGANTEVTGVGPTIKQAQELLFHGDGTYSVDLNVAGPNGAYTAPLTDTRDAAGQKVRKIPLALTAEYAKANADHGKLALMALERDPEGFLSGLQATTGDKAGLDSLRKQNEKLSELRAVKKLEREDKDAALALINDFQYTALGRGVTVDQAMNNMEAEYRKSGDTEKLKKLQSPSINEAVRAALKVRHDEVYKAEDDARKHKLEERKVVAAEKTADAHMVAARKPSASSGDGSLTKLEQAELQALDHQYTRASISYNANLGRIKDVFDAKEKAALQAVINADKAKMEEIEAQRTAIFRKKGGAVETAPIQKDTRPPLESLDTDNQKPKFGNSPLMSYGLSSQYLQ